MIVPLRRLFSEKTDNVFIQLLRYGVVGGFAFAVDLGTLVALTELAGCHYLVSATVGFALGVATNYLLSIFWVFHERTVRNRTTEFVVFLILGVLGLGINHLTLFVLTGLVGIHYTASKVVATGLTFVWNFVSRKLLLFTRARVAPQAEPGVLADETEATDKTTETVTV
jgi:putative flippase GtrA